MNAQRLVLGLFLLFLVGVLAGQPVAARALVIGTISDEPVKEIRVFTPFARYLAKQLESSGISAGKVVIANSITQMAEYLRTGKVDLYVDSPLVALAVNKGSGSRFLVRRWKKGIADYRAVVFVRKDSGITDAEDLVGRVIAFEEHFSSSGHLLPRIAISQQGLRFGPVANPQDSPEPDRIGFTFTGDDENTMESVLRGRVDAGAMSQGNFEKHAKGDRTELRIISRTYSIPRHVVSIASSLSNDLNEPIKIALLDMHQSEEGQAVLESFEGTAKFDEIPPEMLTALENSRDYVVAVIEAN